MTEQRYQEFFAAVAALCGSLKARSRHLAGRANNLRSIAQRLHDSPEGWDHEEFLLGSLANDLEQHATEIVDGVKRVISLGDECLDETQQDMPVLEDDAVTPTHGGLPKDDDDG